MIINISVGASNISNQNPRDIECLMGIDEYHENLTFGFIRDQFTNKKMEAVKLFPRYMTRMMGTWAKTEWLYLMEVSGEHSWKTNVDKILNAVD